MKKTLTGWLKQVQAGTVATKTINFGAYGLVYCDSSAREALIASGWTIADDEQVCQVSGANPTTFNISENQTAIGTISTVGGTGIDQKNFSLATGSGDTNNSLVNIGPSSGALSFKSAPAPGTYSVRVKVSTNADTNPRAEFAPVYQTLTINVKDTHHLPSLLGQLCLTLVQLTKM